MMSQDSSRASGSSVVLVDPRHPSMVPVEAIELLTGEVQYTEELPVRLLWTLPVARPVYVGEDAPVLVSSDREHAEVRARIAAGAKVIEPPVRQGEKIIEAVAMMDRLRTNGPWESRQTHDSLRRYLLEETYELFDAVRTGDAGELRDELGDVLLQVLFHARIAEDAPEHSFNIDDVADALLRKLGNRVPLILGAGGDANTVTLEEQLVYWEQRKAKEKARDSCLDGVSSSQPALALTQKVLGRVRSAGLPEELIPAQLLSVALAEDGDAENLLRADVLEFMDTVRRAEAQIRAQRRGGGGAVGLDIAGTQPIGADEWRRHWLGVGSGTPKADQPSSEPPQ